MNMGRREFLLTAAFVATAGAARSAGAQGITFQQADLTITSQTGTHRFTEPSHAAVQAGTHPSRDVNRRYVARSTA